MALDHARPGETVNLLTCSGSDDGNPRRAIVKTDRFQAMYVTVHADTKIAKHRVPGQATVQCLCGKVALVLDEGTVTMNEGDWLYLERNQDHAVEGVEDGALLVTILFDEVST
jgi:quercetin dioxygenase-like cupin family protein